jgi:hypothetical protein
MASKTEKSKFYKVKEKDQTKESLKIVNDTPETVSETDSD